MPPGTIGPVPSGKTPTPGVAAGTWIPVPVMPVLGTPIREYKTFKNHFHKNNFVAYQWEWHGKAY